VDKDFFFFFLREGVQDSEVKQLRLFSFYLKDDTKQWFDSLPTASITTWMKCKTSLEHFSPTSLFLIGNKIFPISNKKRERHFEKLRRGITSY